MKKVLFTATVDSHILHFHIPFLKLFKDKGYEVHVATNGDEKIPYCDKKHVISFERSPFKINNLKAIKQLKKVIEEENFEIIHCHTPMGSVVTRLAARRARKNGTRVIYTAHGFHFYKGAPLLNWMLFYPIEKWLSRYTDTLITINDEDYQLAKKKFKKTNVEYVPGVGIDPKKFDIKMSDKEKDKLRKEIGIKKSDFVLSCIARLDKNKNQGFLISALEKLIQEHNNIHLLLVGPDECNGIYHKIVEEKKLHDNVHFLGNRDDVANILHISDVVVSASSREGLPVNVIEALTCSLPVVAIQCRGMNELIENGKNGFVIKNNSKNILNDFVFSINNLYLMNSEKIKKIKNNNFTKSCQYYIDSIIKFYDKIYFKKSR